MYRISFYTLLLGLLMTAPVGALSDDGSTQLTLSAHAERQVDNDLMTVHLSVERRAPEVAQATQEVNRLMRHALDRVEQLPAIEARSLSYTTSPVYDRDRSQVETVAWQVRQVLELKGFEFDLLTQTVAELQESGMAVSQIQFSVSPEARARHRKELLAEAIQEWQQSAQAMGAALGASHILPKQLTLQDDGVPGPRPMLAMSRMDDMAAAPALEAGRSLLRVSVTGDLRAFGADTLRTTDRR